MKIERLKLLNHLNAIYCDGLITEAVFSGPFAAVAKSGDGTIVVETAGLEGVENLQTEAGFGLKVLTQALAAEPVEHVEVGLSQRLFVGVGPINLALITNDPVNTTTKVPEKTLAAVRKLGTPVGDGYHLDPAAVKSFLGLRKLLPNAGEVRIVLGAESGFRLGKGTESQGQVALPGVSFTEQSERLVPAHSLSAVLNLAAPDARIWFGTAPNPDNPNGAITIKSGRHTYYLSVLAEETR